MARGDSEPIDTWIGGPVATTVVAVRDSGLVVTFERLLAYPAGLSFDLVVRRSTPNGGWPDQRLPSDDAMGLVREELPLRRPSGVDPVREMASTPPESMGVPAVPSLRVTSEPRHLRCHVKSGRSSTTLLLCRTWTWPLPSEDVVYVIGAGGLREYSATIPLGPVLDAASRAEPAIHSEGR